MNRPGFCVFTRMFFQGAVPSMYEADADVDCNAPERICVFATEIEAQREIVDFAMIRLQQFLDGERDFNDAITVEEYVLEVEVLPDGSVIDANGNHFGAQEL